MQSPFKNIARPVVIISGLATLVAACAPEGGIGSFYREAGAQLETGYFAEATVHNQLVQTCRSNGSGFGKAGYTAGDAVVVLDPSSTASRPVYRVHCDGRLDGKYASIIYSDYVASASSGRQVEAADTR